MTMAMMILKIKKKYWWWISDSDSNPSSARGSSGWARELWRKKREVEKKETWQLPERRPSNLTNPRLTHDSFYISRFCNEPIERCDGTASNFWIRVLILLDDEKFLVFNANISHTSKKHLNFNSIVRHSF